LEHDQATNTLFPNVWSDVHLRFSTPFLFPGNPNWSNKSVRLNAVLLTLSKDYLELCRVRLKERENVLSWWIFDCDIVDKNCENLSKNGHIANCSKRKKANEELSKRIAGVTTLK